MSGDATGQVVVFSMGSNQGDSAALLQQAVDQLGGTPGIEPLQVSPAYRTAPVGPVTEQPDFLNIVLRARTTLTPHQLLERAHQVEDALGRVRVLAGGPRTLDVDLVVVGEATSDDPALTLPHPRAHERGFVLVPWHAVDPDASIPGHGPVAGLLSGLDTSDVVPSDEQVVLP